MLFFHLALIFTWLGLVVAETVIEFALGTEHQAIKAKLHFWIDLTSEVPVVLGVLVTGILLTVRMPELSRLLQVKIGFALAAIAVNLYCAALVALRYKHRQVPATLAKLDARIRATWVGVPFGLTALYLGLVLAGLA